MLSGKTITVGVTGGIAAYKACELVSLLKKAGADVHVVLTEHAAQFVTPLSFEALSGNRAVTDMFDRNHDWEIGHISLARKSDLFVIAPCTANLAGKFANGIADDFLSTTLMAARCPVLLAPAMNTAMLESAAYTANEQTLRKRGVLFVSPESGRLACGDNGKGRMAEPKTIFDAVLDVLTVKRDYENKTVLVTSGGTREPIDPVRFIGNRSSGKMGAALAEAAAKRGAKVIYVAATNAMLPSVPAEIVPVQTTEEMRQAVNEKFALADIIIKAAAPADYSPEQPAAHKIKEKSFSLALKKNPDIAAEIGKKKGERKLVIFSAETENLEENARKKLQSKNADMVVANNVLLPDAGFDTDTNIATIITRTHAVALEKMPKSSLADVILNEIAKL
ncbi:MAG: bifunctional phosphopantothenoylcysteine decarboxylase/phosphopantothenate--cysteine ligase CoaBC [Clostridia bacterium]|nr:bifunctional phosphopantothenoylcysteine decarboxylase/phosphopantothenate--cysteine ligase CoaBC [Clostridia bacterium]